MFADNELSPIIFILCDVQFLATSITIDRVFLLLKAHLLGMTRGDLYSRNVTFFYYCVKINFLESTMGFTIL